MTAEEVYTYILNFDRNKPLTKKYLVDKFSIPYSVLYKALDKLKKNGIIESHFYTRTILFADPKKTSLPDKTKPFGILLTVSDIYNYIITLDKKVRHRKKEIRKRLGVSNSSLCMAIDRLEEDNIINNKKSLSHFITFQGYYPVPTGKSTTRATPDQLPKPPIGIVRGESKTEQMYNYILSLDRQWQYRKSDIRKRLGCQHLTQMSYLIRRLKSAGIVTGKRKAEWITFTGHESAKQTPPGYELPPYKYSIPSIQNKMYEYIKALNPKLEYRKKDILRLFNTVATNLTAVINRLKEEMIIEDGKNSHFIKFTGEDPNNYFVIDEEKERQYKAKMEPYIREIIRPLPEYLRP